LAAHATSGAWINPMKDSTAPTVDAIAAAMLGNLDQRRGQLVPRGAELGRSHGSSPSR
jgi:hypothetical protein